MLVIFKFSYVSLPMSNVCPHNMTDSKHDDSFFSFHSLYPPIRSDRRHASSSSVNDCMLLFILLLVLSLLFFLVFFSSLFSTSSSSSSFSSSSFSSSFSSSSSTSTSFSLFFFSSLFSLIVATHACMMETPQGRLFGSWPSCPGPPRHHRRGGTPQRPSPCGSAAHGPAMPRGAHVYVYPHGPGLGEIPTTPGHPQIVRFLLTFSNAYIS
jgi:hypothetical protein